MFAFANGLGMFLSGKWLRLRYDLNCKVSEDSNIVWELSLRLN